MPEDYLQVAGAQTGDHVRTSRKNIAGDERHEEYVINDVPWTVIGAYWWGGIFTGPAGVGSTGVLLALYRDPTSAYDIVLRRIGISWYNETAAGVANTIALTRTTVLPAANTPIGALAPNAKKNSAYPASIHDIYIKPSGITLSATELAQGQPLVSKTSTSEAMAYSLIDFTQDGEPFVLRSGESAALFLKESAGLTSEQYAINLEWHDVIL